jgi:hypothetical protein
MPSNENKMSHRWRMEHFGESLFSSPRRERAKATNSPNDSYSWSGTASSYQMPGARQGGGTPRSGYSRETIGRLLFQPVLVACAAKNDGSLLLVTPRFSPGKFELA